MLREQLEKTLERVNDWLKFAESKNAVIIALNAAAVFGLVSTYPDMLGRGNVLGILGMWFIAMSSLSTIVSLFSFLPQLGGDIGTNKRTVGSGSLNLIYFGTIASLDPDEYLLHLSRALGIDVGSSSDLDRQYAQQIVVNSRIAVAKYRMFTAAVWLDFLGIIPPLAILALVAIAVRRRYGV